MTVSIKLLSSHINFHGRSIVQKQTDEREKEKKKKKVPWKANCTATTLHTGASRAGVSKNQKGKKRNAGSRSPSFSNIRLHTQVNL